MRATRALAGAAVLLLAGACGDGTPPVRVVTVASTTTTTVTVPATTTTSEAPRTVVRPSRKLTAPRVAPVPKRAAFTLPDGSPCRWADPKYCWSDNPWHVLSACEAGMDPKRNSGNGYYGAFQFSLGTWRSIGESGYPTDYDWDHQQRAAARLRARSGWGQWPSCSRRLNLYGAAPNGV